MVQERATSKVWADRLAAFVRRLIRRGERFAASSCCCCSAALFSNSGRPNIFAKLKVAAFLGHDTGMSGHLLARSTLVPWVVTTGRHDGLRASFGTEGWC